jgi:hypothetical protein
MKNIVALFILSFILYFNSTGYTEDLITNEELFDKYQIIFSKMKKANEQLVEQIQKDCKTIRKRCIATCYRFPMTINHSFEYYRDKRLKRKLSTFQQGIKVSYLGKSREYVRLKLIEEKREVYITTIDFKKYVEPSLLKHCEDEFQNCMQSMYSKP